MSATQQQNKRQKYLIQSDSRQTTHNSQDRYIELGVIIIVFIAYFCGAWFQKFNYSPDEKMRFDICRYIYDQGRLPYGWEESIRNPIWGISYGFAPYVSSIIGVFFMKAAGLFTNDLMILVKAARMASVLFGTGAVWFTMKIGNRLFSRRYKWFFTILVAFLPQFMYLSSYINNDAMAVFSGAFLIYMWLVGDERSWDWRSCLGLAVGVSVCALSYYNAYAYILCSMIFFVWSAYLKHEEKPPLLQVGKKILVMCLIAMILGGSWFIRNYFIYDGDFLGMATSTRYAEMYAAAEWKPSLRETPQMSGISIVEMAVSSWAVMVFKSFCAVFGYMTDFMHPRIYHFYFCVFLTGGIGLLAGFKKLLQQKVFYLVMAIAVVIPNILNVYYSYSSDYQPQGRYSMPMLIPFMCFVTIGIESLLRRFCKNVKIEKWIVNILLLIWLIIAGIAFCYVRRMSAG